MDIFINSLNDLLNNQSIEVEGFILEDQARQIQQFLMNNPQIKVIAESGFNAGMSSAVMLNTRPDITVYSFDDIAHEYTPIQKNVIDSAFPNRHTLIAGNTLNSLPRMLDLIKEPLFDFVFVDGGHTAPVPESDIRNFLQLLKPGHCMCVDDYNKKCGYLGVVDAVDKVIQEKLVEVVELFETYDRTWIYLRKL